MPKKSKRNSIKKKRISTRMSRLRKHGAGLPSKLRVWVDEEEPMAFDINKYIINIKNKTNLSPCVLNNQIIISPSNRINDDNTVNTVNTDNSKILDNYCTTNIIKSGSEGTTRLNCPTNEYITKLENFKERQYEDITKNHYGAIQQLNGLIKDDKRFSKYFLGVENLCYIIDPELSNPGKIHSTMKFIKGSTLHDYIATTDQTTLEQNLKEIILQVVDCMKLLQRHELYHNDLHVENIMVTNQDGSIQIKVIDYGYMSRGSPLNTNYRSSVSKDHGFRIDYTQFLNSMIKTCEIKNKYSNTINLIINEMINKEPTKPYIAIGPLRSNIVISDMNNTVKDDRDEEKTNW